MTHEKTLRQVALLIVAEGFLGELDGCGLLRTTRRRVGGSG